ncbi:MAG: hypothetical protein GXX08_06945 [Firmicutes bacterium]|nr:hypothetical protein [Bacillota bacterium]
MLQFVVTPAAGKRLIAKGIAQHPEVKRALTEATVVVVAGTTNGYVAEELLQSIGQSEGFSKQGFMRGITVPPHVATSEIGRLPNEFEFPGDVIVAKGQWVRGKTVFDVLDDLKEGDIILKGANAIDPGRKQAAILIGHPKAGTIGSIYQAVVGRRVRLILPVGLEKRVASDLNELAAKVNSPGSRGPRLFPVAGEVFTEIEALRLLAGVEAEIVAAGGVRGAEGAVWLGVWGPDDAAEKASELIKSVAGEPQFPF